MWQQVVLSCTSHSGSHRDRTVQTTIAKTQMQMLLLDFVFCCLIYRVSVKVDVRQVLADLLKDKQAFAVCHCSTLQTHFMAHLLFVFSKRVMWFDSEATTLSILNHCFILKGARLIFALSMPFLFTDSAFFLNVFFRKTVCSLIAFINMFPFAVLFCSLALHTLLFLALLPLIYFLFGWCLAVLPCFLNGGRRIGPRGITCRRERKKKYISLTQIFVSQSRFFFLLVNSPL